MLGSINWSYFIVWLASHLGRLGKMCIITNCRPVSEVANFEINLSFLVKPFSYKIKKSWQKFKYLNDEKSF